MNGEQCDICARPATRYVSHAHPMAHLRWTAPMCTECSVDAFARVAVGDMIFRSTATTSDIEPQGHQGEAERAAFCDFWASLARERETPREAGPVPCGNVADFEDLIVREDPLIDEQPVAVPPPRIYGRVAGAAKRWLCRLFANSLGKDS